MYFCANNTLFEKQGSRGSNMYHRVALEQLYLPDQTIFQ